MKRTRLMSCMITFLLIISLVCANVMNPSGLRASATEGSTITVIFDPDGGVVNPTSKTVAINGTYGELPTPTRPGCDFSGWYTELRGGGTEITQDSIVSFESDITLYAKWIMTVILEPDSDDMASTTKTFTVGEKLGELPTPTRAGYHFFGWRTGVEESSVEVGPDTVVDETSIPFSTIYAHWEPNSYAITFDAQGGSTEVEQYTYTIDFDSPYILPEIMPTRTHYTFGGWYTEPNGAGTEVTSNTQMTTADDHTLYAKWIPDTYTVTFYFHNGHDLTVYDTKIVSYGEPYGSLPVPERATYTFGGWYTSTYGGGTKITDTTLVTRASDHSLYTYWTRPKVTVTFDLQDGTGNTFTRELEVGGTYTTMDVPQRGGYTMQGWFTEPNGGGIQHNASTVISSPTAYTLYAKWAPKAYTVNLDAQGGGGVDTSLTRLFDSAYGPLPTPTRQHYIFDGWYTESGGNGTLVTDDTIVSTAYSHTLYAKWLGNPYTVTLYPQDGEFDVTTMTVRHGSPYGLPKPSRAHYVFTGWYTAPDNSGTLVTPETTVTATGDHALYAKWIEAGVTVTLDYQGGEGGPTVLYRNLGDKYELPEPTRTGYEFYAWSTTPGLGGKYYYENAVVDNPEDHTLYAYWVRIVYLITFDVQGGTLMYGSSPKYISYGNAYDLPYASKENYRFGGWWTEPYGRGTQIQGNMKPTADQTLYAYWTPDFGSALPSTPEYVPTPVYIPMPPVTPGSSDNSAYIAPPGLPPVPTPPSPGMAPPSLVVTGAMPDGSERVLPGNYNSDTGQFSFLYDNLPENLGDSVITAGYSTAAPSGIPEDHWAYQDTSMLLSQGILDGMPTAPDTTMTRGDLITMLYRTVAFPLDPDDNPAFSDTEGGETAINWAAERGLINGHPDGTFRPDAEITRQEVFVVLARFLDAYGIMPPDAGTGSTPQEFSNTDDIADWAYGYVDTLIRYGLIRGTPGEDGPEINPLSNISAAELISLIARILRLV